MALEKELKLVITAKDMASSVFAGFQKSAELALSPLTLAEKTIALPFQAAATAVSTAFSAITGVVAGVGRSIKTGLEVAMSPVTILLDGLKSVTAVFQVIQDIAGVIARPFETLKGIVVSFGDTLETVAKTALLPFNMFADAVTNIQSRVNQFLDGSIFKLASAGGEYAESFGRAQALAQSLGQNLDAVTTSVDKFGDGALRSGERVTLAAEAIKSGLSGPQMDTVLEYAHKFSETTGRDFKTTAETIFKAFETGRFEMLQRQFGITVAKGESVADIFQKISARSREMGDDVFNTADNIKAMKTDMDDWVTAIGYAINQGQSWQDLMNYLTDAVDWFVKSFDYSSVGVFFETILQAAKVVYDVLGAEFAGVGAFIVDVFNKLRTKSGASDFFLETAKASMDFVRALSQGMVRGASIFQGFAKGALSVLGDVIGGFGMLLDSAGEMWALLQNGGINLTRNVATAAGWLFDVIGEGYSALELGAFQVAQSIQDFFSRAMVGAAQSILELIQSSSIFSEFLDVEEVANGLSEVQRNAGRANREWAAMRQEMEAGAGKKSLAEEWGKQLDEFAGSMTDDYTDSFSEKWGDALQGLGMNIDESLVPNLESAARDVDSWINDVTRKMDAGFAKVGANIDFSIPDISAKTGGALGKARALGLEAQEKRAADQAKREADKANREMEQQLKKQTDALKKREDLLKKRKTDIESEIKTKGSEGQRKYGGELDEINKALAEIDQAEKKTRAKDVSAIKQGQTNTDPFGIKGLAENAAKAEEQLRRLEEMTKKSAENPFSIEVDDGQSSLSVGADEKTMKLLEAMKSGKIDMSHRFADEEVEVTIPGLNWPAALADLVKAIIKSMVEQVRSERLPMVLTSIGT